MDSGHIFENGPEVTNLFLLSILAVVYCIIACDVMLISMNSLVRI